ncbi:MAG TPA: carbohydrate binding domain-containing protein [Spirochaetota bacterium]|nr:carbohydrate binding domain-containing protein [Spirochaetota bacterium]
MRYLRQSLIRIKLALVILTFSLSAQVTVFQTYNHTNALDNDNSYTAGMPVVIYAEADSGMTIDYTVSSKWFGLDNIKSGQLVEGSGGTYTNLWLTSSFLPAGIDYQISLFTNGNAIGDLKLAFKSAAYQGFVMNMDSQTSNSAGGENGLFSDRDEDSGAATTVTTNLTNINGNKRYVIDFDVAANTNLGYQYAGAYFSFSGPFSNVSNYENLAFKARIVSGSVSTTFLTIRDKTGARSDFALGTTLGEAIDSSWKTITIPVTDLVMTAADFGTGADFTRVDSIQLKWINAGDTARVEVDDISVYKGPGNLPQITSGYVYNVNTPDKTYSGHSRI